jgi:cell division protein FtsL
MSQEKPVTEEKEKKPNLLKSWWSMQWLTGNMNYFMFLCLLAVLYIANGHMADKTIRDINKTQKELKELQFEYKTLKSEVMFKSEEAQVLQAAEPLGLKISTDMPQRLQQQNWKPAEAKK